MNWYKKAQINSGKVKYNEDEIYVLSKNTKLNEGPWRISLLVRKRPYGHDHYPTYEAALERFNDIEGVEAAPDFSSEQKYELV